MRLTGDRFLFQILDKVGLCIQLYDILSIQRGFVYQGDGAQFLQVKFRMIVFAPRAGEILEGSIQRSTPNSIQVSLGFFDQIYIPASLMQDDTYYRKAERIWVWDWEGAELAFHDRDIIRFRVQQVTYTSPSHSMSKAKAPATDAAPPPPVAPTPAPKPKTVDDSDGSASDSAPPKPVAVVPVAKAFELPNQPMVILASVHEMGLGVARWWAESADQQQPPAILDRSTEINSSSDKE
jgi:DNA-directed RNA polymerase III subunit RPC8